MDPAEPQQCAAPSSTPVQSVAMENGGPSSSPLPDSTPTSDGSVPSTAELASSIDAPPPTANGGETSAPPCREGGLEVQTMILPSDATSTEPSLPSSPHSEMTEEGDTNGMETPIESFPSPSSLQSERSQRAMESDASPSNEPMIESGMKSAPEAKKKPQLTEQPTMSASSDEASELSFVDVPANNSSPITDNVKDPPIKGASGRNRSGGWVRSAGRLAIVFGFLVLMVGIAQLLNSSVGRGKTSLEEPNEEGMSGSGGGALSYGPTAHPTSQPSKSTEIHLPRPAVIESSTEKPTAKIEILTAEPSVKHPTLMPTTGPAASATMRPTAGSMTDFDLPTDDSMDGGGGEAPDAKQSFHPTGENIDSNSPTAGPTVEDSVESNSPTAGPTAEDSVESNSPTAGPTAEDSVEFYSPTYHPTSEPLVDSSSPTASPTSLINPTQLPTIAATEEQSVEETIPTQSPTRVTYVPGELTTKENGLLLSTGLKSRIIARSTKRVKYSSGQLSRAVFHLNPDFGGTFPVPDDDDSNPGGWIYASNSEVEERGEGGVGAITFNKHGEVIGYEMILKGTTMNCGGGKTPWNTWISCEEDGKVGQVWEVDPSGSFRRQTVLGGSGGRFESFAYDDRDLNAPRFFVTEDFRLGALRRFTPHPDSVDWTDPTKMLHGKGTLDYLVLTPSKANAKKGTFTWTNNLKQARNNAFELFPNTEGIDVANGELFFVSKQRLEMTVLDLDSGKYHVVSTTRGLFDGKPDQLQRITNNRESMLFFTEEGGVDAGVHARDMEGRFFTILESPTYKDETTGLSFSPDGKHMYVAYQKNGLLFDVWRDDGLPFDGRSINVKFHATDTGIER